MAGKKNLGGRPGKINAQLITEFKTFIIAGLTLKEACEQVGIDTSTWRKFTKRHPSYSVKFHKWRNELEARAKLNIAVQITNNKSSDYSTYYLDYKMRLKEKAAQVALNRARTKQVKLQNKLQQRQLEQVDSAADTAKSAISKLDVDTLKKLAHLADGDDDNATY